MEKIEIVKFVDETYGIRRTRKILWTTTTEFLNAKNYFGWWDNEEDIAMYAKLPTIFAAEDRLKAYRASLAEAKDRDPYHVNCNPVAR